MRNFDTLVIHCAATKPDWMAGRTAKEAAAEIDRWHKARGWKGIGYHYVIGRDGDVATGRHLNATGAHVKGHNTGSVGICLLGGQWPDGRWGLKTDDFADHFTPEQDKALRALIADLRKRYPGIKYVTGHNDYTDQKGCPSFTVSEWLRGAKPARTTPKPPTSPRAPVAPPEKPKTGGLAGFLAGLFALVMSWQKTPKPRPVDPTTPRGFVPVPHDGRTIWVMPDFYKRGGIRMPVDMPEAERIIQARSRELGVPLTLPTKGMVDSIHKAADVRLMMPVRSDKRQDQATYGSVDAQIETALRGRSGLLSGHKKEILRPLKGGKVTIYGGMKADGSFWQQVSSGHVETYTDYSHGLRLVYDPEG